MGTDDMNEITPSNNFALPKKINDFKAHSNSGQMKTSSLPSTVKSRSGFQQNVKKMVSENIVMHTSLNMTGNLQCMQGYSAMALDQKNSQ